MNEAEIEFIRALYKVKSKHSSYQSIHPILAEKLGLLDLSPPGKSEESRQSYFDTCLSYAGKSILDIGANTGFFAFAAYERGASEIECYEGNELHAGFIKSCVSLLGLEDRIRVFEEYFHFERTNLKKFDICLCLNVLHHLGDDFDSNEISMIEAKELILRALNNLSCQCKYIFYQMGFNWKGNRNLPLFARGTKAEIVDYIRQGTRGYWSIEKIGVMDQSGTRYKDANNKNLSRFDQLGEFLNRPIFFMRSKH